MLSVAILEEENGDRRRMTSTARDGLAEADRGQGKMWFAVREDLTRRRLISRRVTNAFPPKSRITTSSRKQLPLKLPKIK